MKVLFITWDGETGGYLETLYFPLFVALRRRGFDVHTLQFSWCPAERAAAIRASATGHGLPYHFEKVTRDGALRTALTQLLPGARALRRYVAANPIDTLMPRSDIPAAMTLLARDWLGVRLPVVFDFDGLALEERVDFAGMSPRSLPYKALRAVQKRMTRAAASVIVRSRPAIAAVRQRAGLPDTGGPPFHVAHNGRDPQAFSPGTQASRDDARRSLGVPSDRPLVVLVAALGQRNDLARSAEVLRELLALDVEAWVRVFAPPGPAVEELLARIGGGQPRVQSAWVPPTRVPALLAAADCGLALYLPRPSTRAINPVKLNEYLLCGVPALSTPGIGDVDELAAKRPEVIHLVTPVATAEGSAILQRWFLERCCRQREDSRARARELGSQECTVELMAESFASALQHAAPLTPAASS